MSIAPTDIQKEPSSNVDALADRLRLEGSRVNIEQCAQEFGYSPAFIQQIVDALLAPQYQVKQSEVFWKLLLRWIGQVWEFVKNTWIKVSDQPLLFVIGTTLFAVLGDFGYSELAPKLGLPNSGVNLGEILARIFVIQFLCFFRHGKLRYPLWSTLVVMSTVALSSFRAFLGFSRPIIAVTIESLAVGSVYAFLGSIAALLGGYIQVQRRAHSVHTVSRQEALDRLFVINERLKKMGQDLERPRNPLSWLDRAQSDPRWMLMAFFAGLALGALRVLLLGGYAHLFIRPGETDALYNALRVFSTVFSGLGFLGIGFLSGGIGKGVASQFLAYAGFWVASFIHLGPFGATEALRNLQWDRILAVVPFLILSGLLSGIGAQVEDAAKREKMLDSNDPAALIAEMVTLRRRFNAESSAKCVLSVDVARSTAMKAQEDPLVVEWSFREFQKFIQECSERAGGQVLSTAGDGAVLTFSECKAAILAAKDIQTRLSWFNMRVNRLESPFRVRIGIHADQVQGEIEDVQFTRVIDLAAHVQEVAPVGGILVTSPVARFIPDEAFTELKDLVEGQHVLLVVNPTFGA